MKRLLTRAREGDPDAFVALIRLHEQELYKVAKGYFKEEEDVADVLQDTILSCFEKIGTLRQPDYFKTWLIRILINKCNDLSKSRNRSAGPVNIEEKGAEDPGLGQVEFMTLLESLEEKYRMVLLLHYGAGFRVREIGELMDLSVDAVKGRLKQGRRKMKEQYEIQREVWA